jgi:hypothetical protein
VDVCAAGIVASGDVEVSAAAAPLSDTAAARVGAATAAVRVGDAAAAAHTLACDATHALDIDAARALDSAACLSCSDFSANRASVCARAAAFSASLCKTNSCAAPIAVPSTASDGLATYCDCVIAVPPTRN